MDNHGRIIDGFQSIIIWILMGYQGEKCDMNAIINPFFMGK
jgi:hypothetical protein